MTQPRRILATFLQNTSGQAILLLVVIYATFFQNLHAIEPSLMEARNFITVREITQNGNWLIPTLNGEPRLAKPPLPTWLTAFSIMGAGDLYNLAALRFPAACMAGLLVYFLFLFTRRLTADRYLPLLAGLVLATSFSFFNIGRQGTWDIYCHAFMMGAIWLFLAGLQAHKKAFGYFTGSGILMGCSFLSKGPISFYALLLPFLLSYGWGYGTSGFKKHGTGIILIAVICLIISLAWPLYVYLHEPAKMATNISNESTAWVNRHVKPFWYYISFPWQAGVWAVFVVAALIAPYARRRLAPYGNYRFLSGWVFSGFILLSIIPEKKERYLLPLLIPMALLTAYYLRYLLDAFQHKSATRADHFVYVFNTILYLVLSVGVPVVLYWFGYRNELVTVSTLVFSSGLLLALGGCFLLLLNKKRFDLLLGAAVALHVVSIYLLTPRYQDMVRPVKNYVGLHKVREVKALNAVPFYAVQEMSPEYIWQVGKKVDTLSWHQKKLQLPAKLPIAVFSVFSITPEMLSSTAVQLKKVGQYQHDRRHPENVYFVYYLSGPGTE